MSRAVVTLATSSSNAGSCAIDFYSVKNYFDSAETGSGVKVVGEDSDEATGIIALDTDADNFAECTDVEITGQLVQFQPLTQETTSITIKGTIFNDASFNWSNILVSADRLNIKCTTTGDILQAMGTWHAITKFRYTLKEEIQQFVKSKKFLSVNADAVHEGVKQVSTLSNDVLALMHKCGVFVNDHLKYNLRSGSVTIEYPGDDEAATTIAEEFQTEYCQLMMGGKLKEHFFPIPSTYNKQQVDELVSQCNNNYSHSIFTHDHKNNVIKCLSMNARQLSHIKEKMFQQPQATQESTDNDTPTSMSLLLTWGRRVTLKQADITKETTDAIVNAANERLSHGGGVALSINKSSNGVVQQQSTAAIRQHGLIKVSRAVHTGAGGSLKCKYVIHTVGPEQYKHKDKCQELLWTACMNTLQLAEKLGVTSIAIPPISSGKFGVPKDVVAKTIISAVCQYPCHPGGFLTDVRIVIIDDPTFEAFKPFFIDTRVNITVGDQPKSGASPCKVPSLKLIGDQPDGGRMTHQIFQGHHLRIPGYERCSTIKITYFIPNGMQGPTHPRPGQQFTGNTFYAYLPNSPEGTEVLELLKKAFNARLVFTVGKNNRVVWNGIHHKTRIKGGYANYGYPDHTYLERVKEQLQLKLGIITIV